MEVSELESVWEKMKVHPITGEEKSFPIGSDGMSKKVFEKHLIFQLNEITRKINSKNDLNAPSYSFGALLYYERNKSSGGTRRIYLPRLKDQLVLKWMHNHLIEAASKKKITLQTKSPFHVVKQFREKVAEFENPVVVRTDIDSFFDSVPRERVIELAMQLDLPKEVAMMLKVWSKKIVGRPLWISGKSKDKEVYGLPQGLSISATLAELWGYEIEQQMSLHGVCVFRFVDDITFLCRTEKEGAQLLKKLEDIIIMMGLSLSKRKTHIERLDQGVPWLGMKHYPSKIVADLTRTERWSKRFIFMRKEISQQFKENPEQDKTELLNLFYYNVRQELKGKTSSRPQWYSLVEDNGQWKEMDSMLHAQFKILHKQLGIYLDKDAKLPSIHKQITARRKTIQNTSPR